MKKITNKSKHKKARMGTLMLDEIYFKKKAQR